MSNFICSECGMNNIDCGYAGYKTPKEIELEKQVKRLQEQLKEANEIIQTLHKRKECDAFDHLIFGKYLEKWGVK